MTLSPILVNNIEKPQAARSCGHGALLVPLVLVIIIALMMLPVFIAEARETWDHGYYIDYVFAWSLNGEPPVYHTHVGYPLALLLLHRVTQLPIWIAGVILNTAAQMMTAYILYRIMLPALAVDQRGRRMIAAVLAFALSLVTAITFLTLPDHNVYFGYVIPHVYHNPTSVLLKPMALSQILLVIDALSQARGVRWRLPLLLAISIAAVIVKPSFVVCVVPPVILLLLWQLWQRKEIDWMTLLFGIILPNVLILGLQSDLLDSTHGGAYFAPLEALRLNDDNFATRLLPIKQILSIAFPLLALAAYGRAALRSLPLMLAWMAYALGVGQMMLLNEPLYPKAINFGWGAQITLFVLFLVSARFVLEQWGGRVPRLSIRYAPLPTAIGVTLLLHTLAGIFWYSVHALAVFSHPLDWRLWW